jgi:hypothetical protein
VTRARGAIDAVEATRATAVLTAETSAQEAAAARDSATLCVKDAKDRAALVEREALEWVSRAEVENSMALASAREDAKGIARKVTLLEDDPPTDLGLQAVSCHRWSSLGETSSV